MLEGSIGQAAKDDRELAEIAQVNASLHGLRSRGRQDEDARAVELLGLQAELAGPLGKLFIGILAVESDHAGPVFLELLCQQNPAFGDFLALQFPSLTP